MTDIATGAAEAPRLHSQVDYDDRGNFEYQGDLYRSGEDLSSLCRRIGAHLAVQFADARCSVRGERFAGGRSVKVELLDVDIDLIDETTRRGYEERLRDQVERFGFTRSNVYQDSHACSFYAHVMIGAAYWTALAARRGPAHPVEPRLPLSAFKRELKPGDALKLVHSSLGTRMVGSTRAVVAVRSNDLILEGPSYLDFPRAARFACDGRMVRIALGNEYDPDAHLLYEWLSQDTEAAT